MLGSHIAEKLRRRGDASAPWSGRVATSASSNRSASSSSGRPDRPESCARAVRGVEVVYHCAAKVGDWGRWHEFESACLDGTRNLAEAAIAAGCRPVSPHQLDERLRPPAEGGPPIDESAPLGQNLWPLWDYYTRSKVDSERLLWDLAGTARACA